MAVSDFEEPLAAESAHLCTQERPCSPFQEELMDVQSWQQHSPSWAMPPGPPVTLVASLERGLGHHSLHASSGMSLPPVSSPSGGPCASSTPSPLEASGAQGLVGSEDGTELRATSISQL